MVTKAKRACQRKRYGENNSNAVSNFSQYGDLSNNLTLPVFTNYSSFAIRISQPLFMLTSNTVLQGRYQIVHPIGQGGMGTVYLAKDQRLSNVVALKESIFSDKSLIRAFEREARLLASLRHSALPKVFDHFAEGDSHYLIMEYIAGDDLGKVLEKRQEKIEPVGEPKPFEVEEVLNWAEQLLDALDYLHTQQSPIIHRDIKPQNIKLTERNQVILLDFGLAKGAPRQITKVTESGSIYGYTPCYAPIEQMRDSGTDPRSDLYSLGATLYHLLTGNQPIDATTRADNVLGGKDDPMPPVKEVNATVPYSLSSILQQALELHRDQRPGSALDMLKMIRSVKRQNSGKGRTTFIDWDKRERDAKQKLTALPIGREHSEKLNGTDNELSQVLSREEKVAQDRLRYKTRKVELSEEIEKENFSDEQMARPLAYGQQDIFSQSVEGAGKTRFILISLALLIVGTVVLLFIVFNSKSKETTSINPNIQAFLTSENFAIIPAGEFMMGSKNGGTDEQPVHKVRISQPFEMGKYEVTQFQWKTVMGTYPSNFKGDDQPVENVSWSDVQQFIDRLNDLKDGHKYRLPTEAEWEYACRAGEPIDISGNLDNLAWYKANSDNSTHSVGRTKANAFGLFDMQGNVSEWCQDWYGEKAYTPNPETNPPGPTSGAERVFRGGNWKSEKEGCRYAVRFSASIIGRFYYLGFRLVRTDR